MTLPTRKTLLANAISLLALAWLYGGDLRDALRAREAEVAAYTLPPSVVPPAVVLVLGAIATGIAAWGLLRRRDDTFRGYRLLPIVLVLALMVDLFRAESADLLSSADTTGAVLEDFRDSVQALASSEQVPSDAAALRPLLQKLPPAPYLVRGQSVGPFELQVREGCTGPASEPNGARPGTLIYCVAATREEGWLSAVGLPAEQRFGPPAMVSQGGVLQVARVQPRPPSEQGEPEQADAERDAAGFQEFLGMDAGVAGPAVVP
ncbi:hypothetical protein P2318_26360 [Myxococcaceae bacterium GXIMD 01537]